MDVEKIYDEGYNKTKNSEDTSVDYYGIDPYSRTIHNMP